MFKNKRVWFWITAMLVAAALSAFVFHLRGLTILFLFCPFLMIVMMAGTGNGHDQN